VHLAPAHGSFRAGWSAFHMKPLPRIDDIEAKLHDLTVAVKLLIDIDRRLRAERDRLRAVVDAALSGLSLMAVEAKCHDDVLISADLYAALSRQLDATPTEEDT